MSLIHSVLMCVVLCQSDQKALSEAAVRIAASLWPTQTSMAGLGARAAWAMQVYGQKVPVLREPFMCLIDAAIPLLHCCGGGFVVG